VGAGGEVHALDVDGSLLLADSGNHLIRRVSPAGEVSLEAGANNPAFTDGWAVAGNGLSTAPTGAAPLTSRTAARCANSARTSPRATPCRRAAGATHSDMM
jgi:hypothetical protein